MALLWADKYRPRSLDEMDYHRELSNRLKRLAETGNQPHMLFVGPHGAGKSSRVHAFLREIYGPAVDAIKVETKSVVPNPSSPSTTIDIQVDVSNYHLALQPSDVGHRDRVVVMQLIKEVAAHPPLGGRPFKVVVINEAGTLTDQAQAALRRTMEKYMKTCRIILVCDSVSRIIRPLRSRCLPVRVGAPSSEDVQKVLMEVAVKESLKLPPELAQKVAVKADGDLRRALLILEAVHTQSSQFSRDQQLPPQSWEVAIDKVVKKVLQEQSPRCAMEVRGMMYELMAASLPSDFLLKEMLLRLLNGVRDDSLKQKAIAAAAHFESTMKQGSKDIFHLEAFIMRCMADLRAATAPVR